MLMPGRCSVRLDASRISFDARRRADSVAPPPRYDPFRGSVTGSAIAGGVVAVFCLLADRDHITGAIIIIMILAFALLYFYLWSMEWNNIQAFETEYIDLLELERAREKLEMERAREKSLPVAEPRFLSVRKTRLTIRSPRKPVRNAERSGNSPPIGPRSLFNRQACHYLHRKRLR